MHKQIVSNLIKILKEEIFKHYCIRVPDIKIEYSLKTENGVLGQMNKSSEGLFTIRLNESLLKKAPELYMSIVIIHEFAHVVVSHWYGSLENVHGKEWKDICNTLGLFDAKSETDLFSEYL